MRNEQIIEQLGAGDAGLRLLFIPEPWARVPELWTLHSSRMHATRRWSSYSDIRRAQIIGALTGTVGTVLLGAVLLPSVVPVPRHEPHGFPFSLGELLWLWVTMPMRLTCRVVGFRWGLPVDGAEAVQQIAASLLVNSLLAGLVATPFGWFQRPNSPPSA